MAFRHPRTKQDVGGHEVACGVMVHDDNLIALAPVEVIPRRHYETIPWYLSERQVEYIQGLAAQAHRVAGAGAHSCVRLIVNSERSAQVTGIENTPPLKQRTLFVQSAAVVGFTLPELKKIL